MFQIRKNVFRKDILNIEIASEKLDVTLSSIGASIFDIKYVDKNATKESVVAHPTCMNEFCDSSAYYGRIVGRTSGRIDKGEFTLDGEKYNLDKNWNGISCLHGGKFGVSLKNFDIKSVENLGDSVEVEFETTAKDGESGFCGDLKILIKYIITADGIEIEYHGKSNKKTLCNLTNHTYFNLSGNCKNDCLNHEIYLNASKYGNVNEELIATSFENMEENYIFNFKSPKKLSKDIYSIKLQNHIAKGYDHPFLLDDCKNAGYIYESESGRKLSLSTTYPCVVMYATCYPDGCIVSSGKEIAKYGGICLEAQHIPNGVNTNKQDSSILNACEEYFYKTKFEFSIGE
ncbi:MAG: aldose epimerase family protein [Bacillota bacterium]